MHLSQRSPLDCSPGFSACYVAVGSLASLSLFHSAATTLCGELQARLCFVTLLPDEAEIYDPATSCCDENTMLPLYYPRRDPDSLTKVSAPRNAILRSSAASATPTRERF